MKHSHHKKVAHHLAKAAHHHEMAEKALDKMKEVKGEHHAKRGRKPKAKAMKHGY